VDSWNQRLRPTAQFLPPSFNRASPDLTLCGCDIPSFQAIAILPVHDVLQTDNETPLFCSVPFSKRRFVCSASRIALCRGFPPHRCKRYRFQSPCTKVKTQDLRPSNTDSATSTCTTCHSTAR
jgi:hypothetical protein